MKWSGFIVAWMLFVVSGFGGCNGGSSSETVSFDEGSVEVISTELALSGHTDAGSWVALYAADFLPHLDSGFADTLRADAHGRFVFTHMPAGIYHMLVRGSKDSLAALSRIADLSMRAWCTYLEAHFIPAAILSRIIP